MLVAEGELDGGVLIRNHVLDNPVSQKRHKSSYEMMLPGKQVYLTSVYQNSFARTKGVIEHRSSLLRAYRHQNRGGGAEWHGKRSFPVESFPISLTPGHFTSPYHPPGGGSGRPMKRSPGSSVLRDEPGREVDLPGAPEDGDAGRDGS